MRAGLLRHVVTFERRSRTGDAMGGSSDVWTPFLTARAAVEPQSGGDFARAGQQEPKRSLLVTIRGRSGVTAEMRVKFAARTFVIQSVREWREKGVYQQLDCIEVPADG